MFHRLRAIFRENMRERYYETDVAAKAKTAYAKEQRKSSRKFIRIGTKSLPGFDPAQFKIKKIFKFIFE